MAEKQIVQSLHAVMFQSRLTSEVPHDRIQSMHQENQYLQPAMKRQCAIAASNGLPTSVQLRVHRLDQQMVSHFA